MKAKQIARPEVGALAPSLAQSGHSNHEEHNGAAAENLESGGTSMLRILPRGRRSFQEIQAVGRSAAGTVDTPGSAGQG